MAQGAITALAADRRIAFTYGYANAHPELPVGASLVTVELHDHADGTRLEFRHELPSEKLRDQHAPGWRYHLAVFANVVADEHHGNATARVDQWFAAWAETDGERRREQLAACATEQVSVRDAYACLIGLHDLDGHIANTHVHLPGMVMRRSGEPRQCQGTVLVDWTAEDATGKALARGTNVLRLAADGRIEVVVGFAG